MPQNTTRMDDQKRAMEHPRIETTMAFQPIVDLWGRSVSSYEALVRGRRGEGADEIFRRVPDVNRYTFDQECRTAAIALASQLRIATGLSVNALPNALSEVDTSLRATIRDARRHGFPPDRLIVELTEWEMVRDFGQLREAVHECRLHGIQVVIDDFGAGHSGLNLLAELAPDAIKLDMGLVRGIDRSRQRREIVSGVITMCEHLDIAVIAEGVETVCELSALQDRGVRYAQGYLFARPAVESLPSVEWPHWVATRPQHAEVGFEGWSTD